MYYSRRKAPQTVGCLLLVHSCSAPWLVLELLVQRRNAVVVSYLTRRGGEAGQGFKPGVCVMGTERSRGAEAADAG